MVSLTIDRASHYLWRFTDPVHPDYDPVQARRWGNSLRDFYRLEDKYVGRLVEMADESDLILITSDHGFCGLYRTFHLNRWLQQQGYLQLQTPAAQRKWLGRLAGRLVRLYRRNARARFLLAPLRRTRIRDKLVTAHQEYRYGQVSFENAAVDWANTTAYALAQDRIYLNVQGRQPQGQVRPSDYDRVLANLVRDISSLKDESGNSVPVQLLRGRDVYESPFMDAAPDLLIFVDNYHCLVGTGIGRKEILGLPRRLSGTHHPDGLFVVRGSGVRTGKRINADIVDIAPTILHALGAPVPAESDGRPLMEAFMESSAFVQKPVRTVKSSDDGDTDYKWSEEDEAQIMQQLSDLGYL